MPTAGRSLSPTLPAAVDGPRLELRRWHDDDLPALMAAVGRSLPELRPWMSWARDTPTFDSERAELEQGIARFDAGEGFEYFLFEHRSAELVGAVSLNLRGDGVAEIGCWVRSDRHRRGYATEAIGTLTSAAFDHLPGVDAIVIRMDRANVASAGIPKKLGYRMLGSESRAIVTSGHTGVGWRWATNRWTWPDRAGQAPSRQARRPMSTVPVPATKEPEETARHPAA